MSERLSHEVGRLAGRLAEFLATALPRTEGALARHLAFLKSLGESAAAAPVLPAGGEPPLERLRQRLGCAREEVDLLLFAGLPEEHEGLAAVMRSLHPRGEPRPSVGLAAQLFGGARRSEFLAWFHSARVVRSGIVRAVGEAPFFERSLDLAEQLWPALHGCDAWPSFAGTPEAAAPSVGLEEWFAVGTVKRAVAAIGEGRPCTVLVTADNEEVAYQRALALVHAAGRPEAGWMLAAGWEAARWRTLAAHLLLRGAVPVLRLSPAEGSGVAEAPALAEFPETMVLAGRVGGVAMRGRRPLIAVAADRLGVESRRALWRGAFAGLAEAAPRLAARYTIEPSAVAEVAADLECLTALESRPARLEDVADAVRARSSVALGGGVKLIRPTAGWDRLVLSPEREAQLRAAIARLEWQSRVLDEWGFLRGRPGARGVRMLFSGPPGTGKTLSAEVLAGALRVDLLLVDISRVVSKWIGETEKNLAAVFDTAERAQAVLFFDEADALFGRRTEVSDAHDRYANLETAYLLARLERFEGLAILGTNLRQNIDPAFLRRLEFVVDFHEPDREERQRLWRCHVPNEELLDADVSLAEIAALYPVVGGFIRNAAVAAAFLAAAEGRKIGRSHFLRAIRREYEKAGRAFPGMPAGHRESPVLTPRKEDHVRNS